MQMHVALILLHYVIINVLYCVRSVPFVLEILNYDSSATGSA